MFQKIILHFRHGPKEMFDAEEVVWSDLGEIDNMYFGFETSHPES
jgi:hypothetical protein